MASGDLRIEAHARNLRTLSSLRTLFNLSVRIMVKGTSVSVPPLGGKVVRSTNRGMPSG